MLQVENLQKHYGEGGSRVEAIGELDFQVSEGEFVSIVGPSGCGKTTLLKCISGLLEPTAGRIVVDGRPVNGPPEGMAVVFQDYSRSLFPWMSVSQNVAFPLKRRGLDQAQARRRIDSALGSVGLTGNHDSYPWQLSGGMQQRVAIARALAYEARVLLMDEPFASVDAQTREDLEDLILAVRAQYRVTVVFVTHDIDESVYLGDRVIVLTRAPTEVREILDVDLPRPRDQVTTKELPRFGHMRAHVYRSIRQQHGPLAGYRAESVGPTDPVAGAATEQPVPARKK